VKGERRTAPRKEPDMTTHMLPKRADIAPLGLALGIILIPRCGERRTLIDQADHENELFVLAETNDDGTARKVIFHATCVEDNDTIRIHIETEDDCPTSLKCPDRLIEQADPARSENASFWRLECLRQQRRQHRPEPGSLVRFERPIATERGQETEFLFDPCPGCEGRCFISKASGQRIAIPYFTDRPFTSVAAEGRA
jgi:hypothetical protein